MRGASEDAHVAPLRWNGLGRGGARLIVRDDASRAVDDAVVTLVRSGFTGSNDHFVAALRSQRSEWVARTVRLGDVERSRRRGLVSFLAEDTVLEFLPRFWRAVTPTLVVVAARSRSEGSELILFPHYSTRGGAFANDAAPLIRTVVRELVEAYSTSARLISAERVRSMENDGSPASQAVVREVLGWR